MALPAWLTVDALKRRIDKTLPADDVLLAEQLEESFEQVQEAPPLGCGRLLVPDPVPVLDSEGKDTSSPVTREVLITGSRLLIPDAREITAVTADTDGVSEAVTGYKRLTQNGVVVQIELPRDKRFAWLWRSGEAGEPWEPWDKREPGRDRTITVTGKFGFVVPSMALRSAIYHLAARTFYERQAGYADTTVLGEGPAATIYNKALPAKARLTLEAFALPAGISGLS